MANADPLLANNHRTNAALGTQNLARSILARHRVLLWNIRYCAHLTRSPNQPELSTRDNRQEMERRWT